MSLLEKLGFPIEARGRIVRRQTTCWDVTLHRSGVNESERWRVHFIHKREFHVGADSFEFIQMTGSHHLLNEFRQPWANLYVSSPTARPEGALETLGELVLEETGGWRSLTRYVNDLADPFSILSEGHGLLLNGPISIVEKAVGVLGRAGVSYKVLPSHRRISSPYALLMGGNFVIADRFRIEQLSKKAKQPLLAF